MIARREFLGACAGLALWPILRGAGRASAEPALPTALLERLLALYAKKYPAEINKWRDKMREGYKSGDRLLLRYTPV